MTSKDPRISQPHPHRSGYRCEIKTITGWKHGPTRPTEDEAVVAAVEKLAALDAAQASDDADPTPNPDHTPNPDTPPNPDPAPNSDRLGADGIRILGPYPEAGGWRCKVVVGNIQKSASMDRSKAEAWRLAEKLAATLAKNGAIIVANALDSFIQSKRKAGLRQVTLDGLHDAISAYFRGSVDMQVCRLTTRTGQALYDRLREVVDPRTGKAPSVSTHRAYLSRTKSWARWVVSRGWLKGPSPIEAIQGQGRRKRGKQQLTIDQTRLLIITCTEHATRGDEGAVATLIAACMALRVSEILSRRVEDLDDDGSVLRIGDHEDLAFFTKTEDSVRTLEIPLGLRPLLAQLAVGKAPGDPLFPSRSASGRRSRQWLNGEVERLCKLAGVPVVCPHSLRGAFTTVAVSKGLRLDLISEFVGHRSSAMTTDHYIAPGVLQTEQLRRGMEILNKRPESAPLPS